jgi:flagellar biosynthesis component FlhA
MIYTAYQRERDIVVVLFVIQEQVKRNSLETVLLYAAILLSLNTATYRYFLWKNNL